MKTLSMFGISVAIVTTLVIGFIEYDKYNTERLRKKHIEYVAGFKGISKQIIRIGEKIVFPDGTELIFAGVERSILKIINTGTIGKNTMVGDIIYLEFRGKCIYEKDGTNDCFGKVDLKKELDIPFVINIINGKPSLLIYVVTPSMEE